ncbi:MAG: HAD family hydrolase [Puniceicoccales bacterium]|jgi:phosphoglycolate phosphatase|nr:HAD family hydrolase [Puniceicoccales bacterium]
MKKLINAILFDLDGTLIDHLPAICRCYNQTLREFGCKERSREEMRKLIGPTLPEIVAQLLPAEKQTLLGDFCQRFRTLMAATYLDGLSPMPGAMWILGRLKKLGKKVAIFTNKLQTHADLACNALGLNRHTDVILGTESENEGLRKPDPAFTEKVLGIIGADADSAAMVGDSSIDMATGDLGGLCATFGVTTGTNTREELLACHHPPAAVFENLFELGQDIFGLI